MRLLAISFLACAPFAGAQTPSAITQDQIDSHLVKARVAAGFDFTGTLSVLCVAPAIVQPRPAIAPSTGPRPTAGRGTPRIPARETWYTEPAKVFDNLYFVGSLIHNSWALKTSDGIILLDTLFNYNSEEEIVGGLKKLGLDPASVKYVIITHAHGDHDGGAKMMQDRFHSRIVMGGPDWDSEARGDQNIKPKRDIVADDGQKITLGDTSVTIVTTPGHTPGTLSMIFPVKDNGKTLMVAYSGGTAFNFPSTVPNFDTYIRSQAKMKAAAAAAHATVLLSNHSEFDSAIAKIKALATRKPGDPNPFDLGEEAVQRYFTVTGECAEAQRLKIQALGK